VFTGLTIVIALSMFAGDVPVVDMAAATLKTHVHSGGSGEIAVRFTIPKGWHIYWKDPGSSGAPTELKVKAPPQVKLGEVKYSRPMPISDPAGPVVGYERTAVLLVPFHVDPSVEAGTVFNLTIEGQWLVCKKVCHLGAQRVQVKLHVASGKPEEAQGATWLKTVTMPQPFRDRPDGISLLAGDWMEFSGRLPKVGHPRFIPEHVSGVDLWPAKIKTAEGRFEVRVPYRLNPRDALGQHPFLRGLLTFGTTTTDPCWRVNEDLKPPQPGQEGENP
jgi:hypothetical protein